MNLRDLIQRRERLLLDGAMGTQLTTLGSENPGGQDNLFHPEMVLAAHAAYAACGCDILTTNTLTMNSIFLLHSRLEIDVREVNIAGVKLAREVIGREGFLLGDMSSTGQLLAPYGNGVLAEFSNAFEQQASILAEAGVDGFIVETVFDLKEAVCALEACRKVAPELPALATMSFSTAAKGGRTIMGNSVEECVVELSRAGAAAIGANCGKIAPVEMAAIVKRMSAMTSLPIIAQPNAGKARLEGGGTLFDMSPDAFAEGAIECVLSGASIIGGCCGTSPDHVSQLAQRLRAFTDCSFA